MKTKTEKLLAVMHVLAWVACIGFMIKAGAILFAYGVSMATPRAAKDLYRGLDLYALRQFSIGHYTATVAFMAVLVALQAYIAYLVIRVLSRIKMESPFKMEIANILERISHIILGAWIITVVYNAYTKWLLKRVEGMEEHLVSPEFILLAGVVFVMAQVFKKGVELQSENELTV